MSGKFRGSPEKFVKVSSISILLKTSQDLQASPDLPSGELSLVRFANKVPYQGKTERPHPIQPDADHSTPWLRLIRLQNECRTKSVCKTLVEWASEAEAGG